MSSKRQKLSRDGDMKQERKVEPRDTELWDQAGGVFKGTQSPIPTTPL